MRRARALLFAPLGLLAACTETVPPHAPELSPPSSTAPTVNVASPTAEPVAMTPFATPVLPPLTRDDRPACEIAKDARKNADSALTAGRNYRALRLVEKANRLCPSDAALSFATKLDALSKLGLDDAARDLAKQITASPGADAAAQAAAKTALARAPLTPPPSGESLLTAALAAHKSSAADARAQLDRAVARLEQEASGKARVYVDESERDPLALSNDGATVALGDGNTVLLVDAKTLRPQRFFDLGETPRGAVLSADGKLLATLTNSAVDVWSAATGKRTFHLVWAGEEPRTAAFSNDGKRLFVGGRHTFDAVLRVWNLDTGDSADDFSLPRQAGVSALALSSDNKHIALGTEFGSVEVWTVSPHKQVVSLFKGDSFHDEVRSISYSPKGDRILLYGRSGKIEVFDAKTWKSLWQGTSRSPWTEGAATFSSDGVRVISGGYEDFHNTLREWDAATGAELQNKPVGVQAQFFSRDGHYALGGEREALGVLDLVSGTEKLVSNETARIKDLRFAPPRMLLTTVDGDKAERVLLPSGARYVPIDDTYGPLCTSLDGKLLAQAGYRGVTVFDVDSGARIPGYPPVPDRSTGSSVQLAPDGSLRVWSRYFDDTTLYTSKKGDTAMTALVKLGERKDLRGLEASDFGRYGIVYQENKVLVLDASTGDLRKVDEDPQDRIREADISADGTALFIAREQRLSRFDTSTGKATHAGISVPCYMDRLESSFDGNKVLAACSEDAYLYTFTPGQESPTAAPLKYGRIEYGKVALSPHGDLVVTGEADGGLTIWDAHGVQRAALRFAHGHDATLVLAPDGRTLLLGKDTAALEDRLSCRVGSRAMPFVACADALGDDDLLADALAPSN
ncbi:MAG: WD40 repeat domain-containing protein [Polyangiaceae bacterium]